MDKYNYRYPCVMKATTFCELCGECGNYATKDGWVTCEYHIEFERPEFPVFDWATGRALDPLESLYQAS